MQPIQNKVQPLQWRHNEHAGVSKHQPYDCLLNRLFTHRSKKTSKLRVTGLCVGNSPVTGEFPTQRASNAETCPFDDVIMTKPYVYLMGCIYLVCVAGTLSRYDQPFGKHSWSFRCYLLDMMSLNICGLCFVFSYSSNIESKETWTFLSCLMVGTNPVGDLMPSGARPSADTMVTGTCN